jgi:predicted transcriptional regulator
MVKIDRASNFENALKDLKDEKLISNKNKITRKGVFKLKQIQEEMKR